MPTIDELFPPKHLRVVDFDQPIAVHIARCVIERIGPTQEERLICYFTEPVKPLILNRTNGKTLVTLSGSEESDDWHGLYVEIYRGTTMYNGERSPCLLLRSVAPADDVLTKSPPIWGATLSEKLASVGFRRALSPLKKNGSGFFVRKD